MFTSAGRDRGILKHSDGAVKQTSGRMEGLNDLKTNMTWSKTRGYLSHLGEQGSHKRRGTMAGAGDRRLKKGSLSDSRFYC